MDSWEQIILEWANCLGILNNPVKDIQELHDVNFYNQLIYKLPHEDYKDAVAEDNVISSFVKAEYPEFEFNFHEKREKLDELLIASLLLLHTAHEPTVQRPMCLKLQNETQIKIKSFLEMVLPYEKNVTKQVLLEAITELEDASPKDLTTTPKTKPLREFFNSPAARSAHSHRIMTERIREIRQLKSELETERFEKMDLHEDIRIQQSKIQKLEKKLEERTAELKALRAEQMRSRTPQSCKKRGDGQHSEDFYKREIEQLENELLRSQSLVDKYDEEKNDLYKKIAAMEKQHIHFKEKYKLCEKSLEMATVQLELKDRELSDLRMNNEELRTHLKEITRAPAEEPSFEGESLFRPRSPMPMGNISESLSSVIDIQFQEAKEEAASLRLELNSLKSKLQALSTDYQKALTQNKILQEKSEILESIQRNLKAVQNELLSAREKNKNVVNEKEILENECQELRTLLASEETLLKETQHCKELLDAEVKSLNETVKEMGTSLLAENNKSSELHQNLVQISTDYEAYRRNTENSLNQIIKHGYGFINKVINLGDLTQAEPLVILNKMLLDYRETYHHKEKEIEKLNTELSSAQSELSSTKEKVNGLENLKSFMSNECKDLKILITKKETDIAEAEQYQNILCKQVEDLSNTICRLEKSLLVETDEKLKLTQELQEEQAKHVDAVKNTESNLRHLLQHNLELMNDNIILEDLTLQTLLKHLEDVLHNFRRTQDTQNTEIISLKEVVANAESTISELKIQISDMKDELTRKQELESAMIELKKDLSFVQSEKDSLLEELFVSKQVKNDLESKIFLLQESVNESKKIIQDLNNTKDVLESMHAETITKLNSIITNNKTENTELSTNIKSMNEKYGLLQEQMSNVSKDLRIRTSEVDALRLEVQNSQAEKERIINLHKNADCKTKELMESLEKQLLEKQHSWDQLNVDLKLKEETLTALRTKIEDLAKEKIASELKLKEVILNLQEVRVNQDAVLTAQGKALNEKCSQLEEVQRELNEVKENFSKQLETEKSLRTELEVQNSGLTNEIENHVKNIEELREDLKQKTVELCKNEEYSAEMDVKQSKVLKTLEELKHSVIELRTSIIELCPKQKELTDKNTEWAPHKIVLDNDVKVNNILNIIQTSASEINIIKSEVTHLQGVYKDLQETVSKQGEIIQKTEETNERIQLLTQTIQYLETEKQSFNERMQFLLRNTELLKEDFSEIMLSRETVETALNVLKEKWCTAFNKFKHIFVTDSSMCDELKHLQVKKEELDKSLHDYEILHLENMRPLTKMLWQTFLWTEEKLGNIHSRLVKTEQDEVDIKHEPENDFSEEKKIIELELKNNNATYKNILQCEKEVEMFVSVASSYESNVNAGQIKKEPRAEEKMKLQIDQLTMEKKDLKSKLDSMRVRNARLEKNMDELRAELKKIKAENSSNALSATEDMNKKVKQLEEDISHLQKDNEELSKRPKEEEFDNRLKEVHSKYERALEDMKQKMKIAYNEQVAKINKQQEKTVQEKTDELKNLCKKHAEEIKRYKEHVGHLTKQLWSLGENLLIAQKEKEEATQQLNEMKATLHNTKQASDEQKVGSTRNRNRAAGNEDLLSDNISRQSARSAESTHEDRMYERRSSMRSMQAMGNAFNAEDEEGEVFDSRYLADMKEGKCLPPTHLDRLSVLQMRNSLCKPHLKSSYPAETQFHPLGFTEEDIKNHSNVLQTGTVTEDVFNDSLTQSLLAEQKPKKRDRTQTSYKKPGPPTPSKNGGRLSLQGNELRSPNSRILRDRNVERRTTITPRRLKDIFSTSSSKRQDENSSTPKGRRLSNIFRKPRTATERF